MVLKTVILKMAGHWNVKGKECVYFLEGKYSSRGSEGLLILKIIGLISIENPGCIT